MVAGGRRAPGRRRRSIALLVLVGCAPAGPVTSGANSAASGSAPAAASAPPSASEPARSASSPGVAPIAPGACWQLSEAARASAPLPARPSTECVAGSPEIERDVGARLAREARHDTAQVAHVDFPCVTLREAPGAVRALVVEGHAGYARVVGLRATEPGRYRARVLRVATGGGPNQTPPGPVEYFRTELPEVVVVGTFERVRAALAARLTLDRGPIAKGGRIELGPVSMSSNNLALELVAEDATGRLAARHWQGYRGSLDAERRLPVEFAWRALGELGLEKIALRAAQPEDRALLREAWLGSEPGIERPPYVTRGLLLLAAHAGSPELIPRLVELLSSEDEELRRLSVDALAAISGRDLRHDPSGAPRELGDVAADYRRECGAP